LVKIKKGDTVKIITGKDRGKTGTIVKILPKLNKVIISGLNLSKKHLRPSRKIPQGGIIDRAMPIHISNVKATSIETKK